MCSTGCLVLMSMLWVGVLPVQNVKPDQNSIRQELLAMAALDQKMMTDPVANPPGEGFQDRLRAVQRKHNQRVREILDRGTWPSTQQIGKDGQQALWLLIQHADQDKELQKLCLVKLEQAVAQGEPLKNNLAYLTDRVLINAGQKQRYGTQLDYDAKGDPFPKAVEDQATLNQRRADMGLEPIEEYLATVKQTLKELRARMASQTPASDTHADQGLLQQQQIDEATKATLTSKDYAKAVRLFDEVLLKRKKAWILDYATAAFAHAHLGNKDQAFQYMEILLEQGELIPENWQESFGRYGATPFLKDDPRWNQYFERMKAKAAEYLRDSDPANNNLSTNPAYASLTGQVNDASVEAATFYERLRTWNTFPVPARRDQWIRFQYDVNDTLKAPYYVYIPPRYDPKQPTGVIIYLHGGVAGKPQFIPELSRHFLWENPLREYARQHNLLMLYPEGQKAMIWWEPLGRKAVLGELAAVKKLFNVDDARVWVTGHSNGATGAFSLAVNAPTPFASFYPFSGPPTSTLLGNMVHRPIYSLSGEKDGYFDLDEMRTRHRAARSQGADWLFHELPGHNHPYQTFEQEEMPKLVDHLLSTARRPLATHLVWEARSGETGQYEWLKIENVTPNERRADWHHDVSYTLQIKEKDKPDRQQVISYGLNVGKVQAEFQSNVFTLKTSQVSQVTLLLHPQMVHFRYPVKVIINGKEVFHQIVAMDKKTMWAYFERDTDRQRLWAAQLTLAVPTEAAPAQEQTPSYQSRTHRDGDDKQWQVEFRERLIAADGSITLRSRGVAQDGTFSQAERRYTSVGEPVFSSQLGSWGKLEGRYTADQVTRLIEGKEDVQKIDRKTLIDPTLFWFWKTMPKEGEAVVVTFAAANVPSTFQIRFTYQGTKELEAAGRKVKAHQVREDPLSVKPGNEVYTLRWFDDQGMEIKRYHRVNEKVFETNLVSWR